VNILRHRAAFASLAILAAAGAAAQEMVPTASADIPAKVNAESVQAGSELFNSRSCVFCHAAGGRGSGRFGPDLSDPEWLHSAGDFDGIEHVIRWGVEASQMKARTPRQFEMNPAGGLSLSQDELEALTAYVWAISRPAASPLVTGQARFIELARRGQAAEAVAYFRQQGAATPARPLFPERALDRLGRDFLHDQAPVALAILRLNAELHPDSATVHDGLGDALAATGDRVRAADAWRRSLAINPDNARVREKLTQSTQ
jgi:mono/diheme cytochrome c family protein